MNRDLPRFAEVSPSRVAQLAWETIHETYRELASDGTHTLELALACLSVFRRRTGLRTAGSWLPRSANCHFLVTMFAILWVLKRAWLRGLALIPAFLIYVALHVVSIESCVDSRGAILAQVWVELAFGGCMILLVTFVPFAVGLA